MGGIVVFVKVFGDWVMVGEFVVELIDLSIDICMLLYVQVSGRCFVCMVCCYVLCGMWLMKIVGVMFYCSGLLLLL